MFRLAVALYLVIVTAVRPAACCCTFTRLAVRASDEPAAPRSACSSCCQHGQEGRQPPAHAPAPPGAPRGTRPSAPDRPGCPCKQAASEFVGLPAAHDEAQEVSLRAVLGEFFTPSVALWTPTPTAAPATPASRESAPSGTSVS